MTPCLSFALVDAYDVILCACGTAGRVVHVDEQGLAIASAIAMADLTADRYIKDTSWRICVYLCHVLQRNRALVFAERHAQDVLRAIFLYCCERDIEEGQHLQCNVQQVFNKNVVSCLTRRQDIGWYARTQHLAECVVQAHRHTFSGTNTNMIGVHRYQLAFQATKIEVFLFGIELMRHRCATLIVYGKQTTNQHAYEEQHKLEHAARKSRILDKKHTIPEH